MKVLATEEKAGKEIYIISFTIPSKYNLDTLPESDDTKIKFKEEKTTNGSYEIFRRSRKFSIKK
jgi:hypothetical protein